METNIVPSRPEGSFALFAKTHREHRYMNKSQLAKRSGVNRTTIVMMEKACHDPNIANAVKLLKGLGLTLADYHEYLTTGKMNLPLQSTWQSLESI